MMLVRKTTNSKGAADEMVELVQPGSELEGQIQQVVIKERERPKFKPTEIVARVQAAGFPKFKMRQHTLLVRELKSRDPKKPFGTYIDQEEKEWRWYDAWQYAVIEHLSSAAVPEKPKLT